MLQIAETMAGRLIKLLAENRFSIALAESCTAGLVGGLLARSPGASAVFWGAFVTYTIEAKQKMLGINAEMLEKYHAASRECACAMAESARSRANSTIALSVTGIAGPQGDGSDIPVGTVWIAGAYSGVPTRARLCRFTGGRNKIRAKAVAAALKFGLELTHNLVK
ncbi:MAG: nicotinamide-nucleotide amidohydrolase family protein [Spirochaetaceae bacterium]|jgi:PncC family amidohydrolase|nr:nicotinamide-nucleotide amidohydrolase family protein [Spirochaetaceae bacterium]